jgi:hypothetical protein
VNFVSCYTQSWGCDWYLYVGVIPNDFLGEALSNKEDTKRSISVVKYSATVQNTYSILSQTNASVAVVFVSGNIHNV